MESQGDGEAESVQARAPRVLVSGLVFDQPASGVQRHNQELLPRAAKLLEERDGSIAVVAGRNGVGFPLGSHVPVLSTQAPCRPTWRRAVAEPRVLRQILLEARAAKRPFDLVHCAHLPAPYQLDTTLVQTVHDLRRVHDGTPLNRAVAKRWVTRAVARASRIITVSHAVRRELAEGFGAQEVDVIPNAADHFQLLTRRVAPDAPLLCFGHIEPRKGQSILLRALASDAALPDLVIAGYPKGDEELQLRDQVRSLGIESRVVFHGPYSDAELPQLLAGAAAAVFPSRLEGFNIGMLEALRAGAPVVGSDIVAHRELAENVAFLFRDGNAGECAAALRAALQAQPARLSQGTERARRYSWDRSAEDLVASWTAAIPCPDTAYTP